MSGQWWESDLIVGPFANITEANAWAAANPSSLFQGLLATSNGQQISWRGAVVGWVACGNAGAGWQRGPLSRFRAAAKPRIFVIGDSNVAGVGTAGWRQDSFVRHMADLAGFRYGSFFGAATFDTTDRDSRVNRGSWSLLAGEENTPGLGIFTGGLGDPLTFTPGIEYDSFDVWGLQSVIANTEITVYVGDSVIGTINQVDATTITKKWTFSVPKTSNQIKLKATGTGSAFIFGIETHISNDSRPEISNLGANGYGWQKFSSLTNEWSPLSALAQFAPTMVMTHCTINDMANESATLAQVKSWVDIVADKLNDYGIDQYHSISWAFDNTAISQDGPLDALAEYLKKTAISYGGAYADARFAVGASYRQTESFGINHDTYHLTDYSRYAPLFIAPLIK